MEKLVRAIASLTATALGAVLLIADGDACPANAAFWGSASYVSACAGLASGSGTLSLDVPAGQDDAVSTATVKRQCEESGLHVYTAWLDYTSCSNGEDDAGVASSLHLSFMGVSNHQYVCEPLDLPVTVESTLSCAPLKRPAEQESGAPPCSITFRPLTQ